MVAYRLPVNQESGASILDQDCEAPRFKSRSSYLIAPRRASCIAVFSRRRQMQTGNESELQ